MMSVCKSADFKNVKRILYCLSPGCGLDNILFICIIWYYITSLINSIYNIVVSRLSTIL